MNLSHTVRYPRAMMIKLLHTPVARWAMLCPQGPYNLTNNPPIQKDSEKLENIWSPQKNQKENWLQKWLIFQIRFTKHPAMKQWGVKLQMDAQHSTKAPTLQVGHNCDQ
jgi:hypothetical protein